MTSESNNHSVCCVLCTQVLESINQLIFHAPDDTYPIANEFKLKHFKYVVYISNCLVYLE